MSHDMEAAGAASLGGLTSGEVETTIRRLGLVAAGLVRAIADHHKASPWELPLLDEVVHDRLSSLL